MAPLAPIIGMPELGLIRICVVAATNPLRKYTTR
jgi:hypothetical protein